MIPQNDLIKQNKILLFLRYIYIKFYYLSQKKCLYTKKVPTIKL